MLIVPTNSLHCQLEKCWPLVNELEDAWTGVEEADRAFISEYVQQGHRMQLIVLRYTIK